MWNKLTIKIIKQQLVKLQQRTYFHSKFVMKFRCHLKIINDGLWTKGNKLCINWSFNYLLCLTKCVCSIHCQLGLCWIPNNFIKITVSSAVTLIPSPQLLCLIRKQICHSYIEEKMVKAMFQQRYVIIL